MELQEMGYICVKLAIYHGLFVMARVPYMMTSSIGNIFRVTTGYWPFVWGIHRLPVNSPHKGQWRGALMFS